MFARLIYCTLVLLYMCIFNYIFYCCYKLLPLCWAFTVLWNFHFFLSFFFLFPFFIIFLKILIYIYFKPIIFFCIYSFVCLSYCSFPLVVLMNINTLHLPLFNFAYLFFLFFFFSFLSTYLLVLFHCFIPHLAPCFNFVSGLCF